MQPSSERAAAAGRRDSSDDARCVHEFFEAHVASNPDANAIACGDRRVSYRALNRAANRCARFLRCQGIGPEALVGIVGPRGPETIAAILAVLKAGGGYVPLNLAEPESRLYEMCERTRLRMIIVCGNVDFRIRPSHAARLHLLEIGQSYFDCDDRRPSTAVAPGNLAVVVFTSGSSGVPKAVALTHHAITTRFSVGLRPATSDASGQKAGLTVVSHVSDLLMPLMAGRPVVLFDEATVGSARGLARALREHGIRRAMLVPSQLRSLLEDPECVDAMRSLEACVVSGEGISERTASDFAAKLPGCALFNSYGCSETVGGVRWARQTPGGRVNVGEHAGHPPVRVLVDGVRPAKPGEVGEIFVGGEQLARGYLDPKLTAARFVPDAFGADGARLYRTGDLARLEESGAMELTGRIDFETKIRGFRVNLADVEAVLERHPAVAQAAVVACRNGEDSLLAAYVVLGTGCDETSAADIRESLTARLPPYMRPAFVLTLDRLPLLRNGKVDRQLLAERGTADWRERPRADQPVSGRTSLETALTGIWSEVLGRPGLDVHDDFFELGGDSLSATRVMSRVATRLNIDSTLKEMWENPTIEGMGRVLDKRRQAASLKMHPE